MIGEKGDLNMKRLSVILALFVLLTAGCLQFNSSGANPNKPVQPDDPASRTESKGGGGATEPSVVSDLNLENIEGGIKNIYYAHGNQVLISADQLYLYDLGARKIAASAPQPAFERENYWVIENGYAAVRETLVSGDGGGLVMTNGANQYHCILYDANLQPISEFDLDSLLEGDEMILSFEAIAVSADGSQVAYATSAGLYLYDWQAEKKTTIIDLASDDAAPRSGIVALEQIGFTDQDKRLAFKAQSFDIPAVPGKPSFDTCGIVNTNGSGLSNQTFDNYTCKELTAYNKHLFLAEDFTAATGRMLVMDALSGKTKLITLNEKKESGNITGSNSGRYFAAPVSDGSGWRIRIYNTDTGAVEAEQLISSEGKELYMANEPIIKLVDETRTCIVLLGSKQAEIDTKMVVSQF